ncbi:MAG: AlpA family phage regulatory protein [Rhizobiales bacterium]|nr:AlpA family phage regulatory protein [Hyphomicrobiales bacterium]
MGQEESKKPLRKILRRPAVESVTGLGRSQIYEGMAEGWFPKNIPLSGSDNGRAKGWLEDEILAYQEARIAEREASNG